MSPSHKNRRFADEPVADAFPLQRETLGDHRNDTPPGVENQQRSESAAKDGTAAALMFLQQVRCAMKSAGESTRDALTADGRGLDSPPAYIGRYRIIRSLGRGGFAEVFLAEDESLERRVALKVPLVGGSLADEFWQRFEREARAAATLAHPSIVPVYEFDCIGPLAFIAYRWFPGVNLAEWLSDQPHPMPPREAAAAVSRIAEAIEHAHQRGVVHRDLKPSNILVSDSPEQQGLPIGERLLVTDFGLARQLENGDQHLTQEGSALGTPAYMSPEQAAGHRELTAATDIWSLGVILYELLTGRLPFRKETALATIQAVQHDAFPPVRKLNPAVPRDLAAICHRCLSRDPRGRYASAFELSADLNRWLGGYPVQARTATVIERARFWISRNPVVASALGLALFSLVAGLAGTTWQWQQARNNLSQYKTEYTRAEENLKAANAALELERVQRIRAQKIARWLGNTYRSPDPRLDGREVRVVDVLQRAQTEIGSEFVDDDETRWTLLLEIGKAWYSLGENLAAIELLNQILQQQVAAGRADDTLTVELHDYLARSLANHGDFDAALSHFEQALRLAGEHFGESEPEWYQLKQSQAGALASLGRLDEATVLREEVVAYFRNTEGIDDEMRLAAEADRANGLVQQRDLLTAEITYRALVPEIESTLGLDHPMTLSAKNDYANALHHLNRIEELVDLRRDLFETTERVMGQYHPQTLLVLNNLAATLTRAGQKLEAIACWNDQLERAKVCFGEASPYYHLAVVSPANTYRELGQIDEALERLQRGVGGLQETLGRGHAKTLAYHRDWLDLLEQTGRFSEALQGWSELEATHLEEGGRSIQSESAGFRQAILRIRLGEIDAGLESAAAFLDYLATAELPSADLDRLRCRVHASVLEPLIATEDISRTADWVDRFLSYSTSPAVTAATRDAALWYQAAFLAGSGQSTMARPIIEDRLAAAPAELATFEKAWLAAATGVLLRTAESAEHPLHDLAGDIRAWREAALGDPTSGD